MTLTFDRLLEKATLRWKTTQVLIFTGLLALSLFLVQQYTVTPPHDVWVKTPYLVGAFVAQMIGLLGIAGPGIAKTVYRKIEKEMNLRKQKNANASGVGWIVGLAFVLIILFIVGIWTFLATINQQAYDQYEQTPVLQHFLRVTDPNAFRKSGLQAALGEVALILWIYFFWILTRTGKQLEEEQPRPAPPAGQPTGPVQYTS